MSSGFNWVLSKAQKRERDIIRKKEKGKKTAQFGSGGIQLGRDTWEALQLGMNFHWEPIGGHHLGGSSCLPVTLVVVPVLKFKARAPVKLESPNAAKPLD